MNKKKLWKGTKKIVQRNKKNCSIKGTKKSSSEQKIVQINEITV